MTLMHGTKEQHNKQTQLHSLQTTNMKIRDEGGKIYQQRRSLTTWYNHKGVGLKASTESVKGGQWAKQKGKRNQMLGLEQAKEKKEEVSYLRQVPLFSYLSVDLREFLYLMFIGTSVRIFVMFLCGFLCLHHFLSFPFLLLLSHLWYLAIT